MTAGELATQLHGTRRGDGWDAKCPAHDDRKASLSIGSGSDARILLKCHAGCTFDAIVAAAGLTTPDLFPPQPSTIVATFDYRDEGGALLYQVVRFSPKDFRPRRPNGKQWILGLGDERRVLYRLPELQGKMCAYIGEGEGVADRLVSLKFPATTSPFGAGKWRAEYVQQLQAASVENVVCFPDNDPVGRAHMEDVATSCAAAGLKVKVVTLADLPAKGDVIDWFDAGHTRDELSTLVTQTALYTPAAATTTTSTGLQLIAIGDFLAQPDDVRDDILEGCIAAGGINLMSAKPKVGKSTAARHLALEVARGGRWLGRKCRQGSAWYLALEGRGADIKKHFRQLGATAADPIHIFTGQAPVDVVRQVKALAIHDRPTLIIIDTMQRFLRAKSADDYAELTNALDDVIAIARESDAAVLLLHHSVKADRAGLDAVLGSTAISGSMDTIFLLGRTDRYRTISSVQRSGEDMPESVIVMDKETGTVHLQGSRREADVQFMRTAMFAALNAARTPLTQPDWLDAVEGRRQLKLEALRDLVNSGTSGTSGTSILRTGAGGKTDPYHYQVVKAGGSGSEVPPNRWEPESINPLFTQNPNSSSTDSGSQVPTQEGSGSRVPAQGDNDHDGCIDSF